MIFLFELFKNAEGQPTNVDWPLFIIACLGNFQINLLLCK